MKHRKTLMWLVSIAIVIALLTVLLALLKGPTTTSKAVKIVAAENVWGNIASQIGGDHVNVTSIITDPTADPHLYESSAKDASAIASADIVIVNGLGYDDFMNKLLDASPNPNRTVITVADTVFADKTANPHLWYDIARVGLVATAIQAKLASVDSADKATYESNLANFTNGLQPLLTHIDTIAKAAAGKSVAYTERLPEYTTTLTQLTNKTPAGFAQAIEAGNEPSTADQSAMQTLITSKQITALLYNSQVDSPVVAHMRDLAAQHGVPTVAMSETLPANTSYQDWMQTQLNALEHALNQ